MNTIAYITYIIVFGGGDSGEAIMTMMSKV